MLVVEFIKYEFDPESETTTTLILHDPRDEERACIAFVELRMSEGHSSVLHMASR